MDVGCKLFRGVHDSSAHIDCAPQPEHTPRIAARPAAPPAMTTMSFSSTGRMEQAMSGTDTFRGVAGASLLRSTLYSKNPGETSIDRSGLVRTESPISGNLLISTGKHAVKDPIAGCTLNFLGDRAITAAPAQKQQMLHSRNLYLTKDIDVTIQT
eukprot:366212-Chlamydomonas_euryale.AAC.4